MGFVRAFGYTKLVEKRRFQSISNRLLSGSLNISSVAFLYLSATAVEMCECNSRNCFYSTFVKWGFLLLVEFKWSAKSKTELRLVCLNDSKLLDLKK